MGYKISDFIHIIKKDKERIFFNSRTLKLLAGNKADEEMLIDIKEGKTIDVNDIKVKYLIENEIIVNDSLDEKEYVRLHRKKRMEYQKNKKNRIGYLRISLTEGCNLQCKYCFVNTIFKDKLKSNMTEEQFRKCMHWFIKENEGKIPVVQYFGGEPLLRMDLIYMGHEMLVKAKSDGKINAFQEEIVTNGTLMDENKAKYFIGANIDVCFSIDGWKEINDKNRVYPDGKGSFESVYEGIKTFCNIGGLFKAIITPTNENIKIFHEIVEYMISDLNCKEVSVNTPQPNKEGWEIDGNELAEAIKKAWTLCDEKRIPFNAPGTNVVFLVNNKMLQSYSCMNLTYGQDVNSYGVYINSSGKISKCVVECDEVCTCNFDEFTLDNEFIDWHYILEMREACVNCIAANICGGPCKIEYEICKNKFNKEKCKFYKNIVPWVISQ